MFFFSKQVRKVPLKMMYVLTLLFVLRDSLAIATPSLTSQQFSSTFALYTQTNQHSGQKIQATATSIIPVNMNAWTDCAIIVHGSGGKGGDAMNMVLRDAFLTKGKTNVIVVDWSVAANDQNMASEAVPVIGDNIVELVRLLTLYKKISRAKLHLVGFDLGAHVVGIVGRAYNDVARITALNPFGGEEWMLSSNHIRPSDALYVEVIHTEVSQIGLPVAVGDVDFFPHGGVRQPGCKTITCSHNRAWQLFAASLTHGGIIGYRCNSLSQALKPNEVCTGFTLALGGNEFVKYGSGWYRMETAAVYPYRCKVKCGLIDNIIEAIYNIFRGGDGVSGENEDDALLTP